MQIARKDGEGSLKAGGLLSSPAPARLGRVQVPGSQPHSMLRRNKRPSVARLVAHQEANLERGSGGQRPSGSGGRGSMAR